MENQDQWDTTYVEKEVDDKVQRAWGKQQQQEEEEWGQFGCSSSLALNNGQVDSCAQG